MNRRSGSALLTVLWLTAALAAVGIAVASNVRGETERVATNVDETKAAFIARGAIDRAALHLLWARRYFSLEGPWPYGLPSDPSADLSFPGAEVHVEIIPERAKLNLNIVSDEELLRLFAALGLPEDRAQEITAAILDWRTPILYGNAGIPDRQSSFDPFYLSQSPSFQAPHTSFLENEEMLLLKGVTPDLFYGNTLPPGPPRPGLRDCLSVRGTQSALDINHAEPAVMIAIGLAPGDVAAIVEGRRRNPVRNPQQLAGIVQALGPAGTRLQLGGRSMYTLRATARLRQPDGSLSDLRRTVSALVKVDFPGNTENQPPKYEIVRWYDRD